MKKVLIWSGAVIVVIGIVFTIFYNTPDRRAKRQAQQIMKVGQYLEEEFEGRVNEAEKETTIKLKIKGVEDALGRFYSAKGYYPSTEQGLKALETPFPNSGTEWYLLLKDDPYDPWGKPFIYRSPGENGRLYDIISLGRDGKEGGSGIDADIKSWEIAP